MHIHMLAYLRRTECALNNSACTADGHPTIMIRVPSPSTSATGFRFRIRESSGPSQPSDTTTQDVRRVGHFIHVNYQLKCAFKTSKIEVG